MPFQKGNTLSKNRTSTKNLLPIIRERVLKTLNKRITIDNALKTVETQDLLKFAQSIMPKDVNINSSPNIVFISQCPRPLETLPTTDTTTVPALQTATDNMIMDSIVSSTNDEGKSAPYPPAP